MYCVYDRKKNPKSLIKECESHSDLYGNSETADKLATAEYNPEEIRRTVEREKQKSKRAKELRVLVVS
jgi:hypothetical protein